MVTYDSAVDIVKKFPTEFESFEGVDVKLRGKNMKEQEGVGVKFLNKSITAQVKIAEGASDYVDKFRRPAVIIGLAQALLEDIEIGLRKLPEVKDIVTICEQIIDSGSDANIDMVSTLFEELYSISPDVKSVGELSDKFHKEYFYPSDLYSVATLVSNYGVNFSDLIFTSLNAYDVCNTSPMHQKDKGTDEEFIDFITLIRKDNGYALLNRVTYDDEDRKKYEVKMIFDGKYWSVENDVVYFQFGKRKFASQLGADFSHDDVMNSLEL
ncbi:MAG: hypothetical protein GOV01_00155 [Candidatus Altiarchaeota archaeon]|nr:hypothetical protein [Candidatus Altiarchaeota archaeon]